MPGRLRIVAVSIVLVGALLFSGCAKEGAKGSADQAVPSATPSPATNTPVKESPAPLSAYDVTARRDLLTLMMAYPGQIIGVAKDSQSIYVVMKSGARLIYDDKKVKSFDDVLVDADLQDMLSQVYPLSDIKSLLEDNNDPGRIRDYAFFSEVYGKTKDGIKANLVKVPDCKEDPVFNQCNGAASALGDAFKEVSTLIGNNKKISGFVYPLSGTFNYRDIAGTDRLSMHSFAIAIDLHLNGNDYWRWVSREKGQKRLDAYPQELVQVFQKHGFIWGGKWAHFDMVHFEYRPEIIMKAKYYVGSAKISGSWYQGFPDTAQVHEAVDLIDKALNVK